MFYTAAWCTSDESTFRKELPFELLGESIKRYHSTLPLHIVLLEGIELLSSGYIRMLEAMGFIVIDYTAGFRKIVADYPNLDATHSRYQRNCLLRWVAFRELFEGHPDKPAQFWHLDSDILLHTSLDELARDTAGKTFMLQGCPVLLTISDAGWFEIYETNLRALEKDPSGYSSIAAGEKAICKTNDWELANISLYPNPIGHDQDLLEYLVASRRLPQDNRAAIYDSKYFFIQNPLDLNQSNFDQQGEEGGRFEMKDDLRIAFGNKEVPFTHYQNTFARYAQIFLLLKRLYLPGFVVRMVLRYRIEDDKFLTTYLYRAIARIWFVYLPGWGRGKIMARLTKREKGATIITLLNFLKR